MHERSIVSEFTQQAESFNTSAVATDADVMEAIVEFAAPESGQRWLEGACGPGLIARRLAPMVAEVRGYDMTPAMVELARREAAAAGLDNAEFVVADATALPEADGSFDGSVSRFAIHHIPVPGRLIAELARVTRLGGCVVLVDHLLDPDPLLAAWSQEVERLRDPSHWASLTQAHLRELSEQAGLTLERERIMPLELDFEDWVLRGTGNQARDLIEQAVAQAPARSGCFAVDEDGGRRTLRLQMWLGRFRA